MFFGIQKMGRFINLPTVKSHLTGAARHLATQVELELIWSAGFTAISPVQWLLEKISALSGQQQLIWKTAPSERSSK